MQRVPRSDRRGEVIEPMISSQWFVKMDEMASNGLHAVRSGEIVIIPERFQKVSTRATGRRLVATVHSLYT